MKRGDIWTIRARGYASKPRPVVIIQSDEITRFDSVITCLLTSYNSENMPTRVRVEPHAENGLLKTSWIMTDKIVTMERSLLGEHIGVLSDPIMEQVSLQLISMLGLDLK